MITSAVTLFVCCCTLIKLCLDLGVTAVDAVTLVNVTYHDVVSSESRAFVCERVRIQQERERGWLTGVRDAVLKQ